VAGIAAGSKYGVAKAATVIGIQVLSSAGTGYDDELLIGLETTYKLQKKNGGPAVINLSLGRPGRSRAIDQALRKLENLGFGIVAAAGNESKDACNYSPGTQP
jgi:subtilisin family serine protease